MRVLRLATFVVLATAAALPLLAQSDTGSIDGRIFDQQKAGVPGVTVTAKNTATGQTRTTVSGTTGSYHLGSLPSGTYDITAELQGFSTQIRKGIVVQVSSPSTADITMAVGNLSETVEVTGETPLVQTTKSDVGQVITNTMVENMPLNGRKFQDLSLLVPGTRPANYYDPTKTEVGGISYGGLSGRSVNISVDGGDNNDGVVRGLLQQFSADAIQEYKVTTQRYSAEFGRSTGGLVNVITKSGTNLFKGSGFLFARNDSLNAKTYFEKEHAATDLAVASTELEKQPFSQQQVGGTFGGPIAKDKAFFFGSYEFNRRNDFAVVTTGGVLPSEEGAYPKPFRNHLVTAKTDLQVNRDNRLLVRYALESQDRKHDFIGGNTLASAGAHNTNQIHSVIAKNSSVLGNSRLNEALFLFQYFENNITAEDNSRPGINTPDFFFGANGNTPQQTIQRRFQMRDDFSFRKTGWAGDHDFKAGGEVIRSHYGGFFTPSLYGVFTYFDRREGYSLADYINNVADSFSGSAGDNEANDNWTYVAAYFQDDWKPMSNLTMNMGLRWEMQAGPYQNNFDTPVLRFLKAAGYNTERKQDTKNFGPRVGFAWDTRGDGKTVVRGGYGLYYDEIFQNITLYEKWNDVRTPLYFISLSPAPFTAGYYQQNTAAIRESLKDPTFSGQIMRLTAPDLKQPYSHQFNAGVSHALSQNLSFDVDYIHAEGRREIHRWEINTPQNVNTRLSPAGVFNPVWNRVTVEGNRGHSRVDGLYVTGKARLKVLELLTTYSLTKAMNIANDFLTRAGDPSNADWESDWGPMGNDVRHRVTLAGVVQLPAGFQLSSSFQANTGKPYNPLIGLGGARSQVRPFMAGSTERYGRNSLRGPGFATWDARVSKEIGLGGGRSIEVLFEAFNLTNRVNLDADVGFNNLYGTAAQPSPNFGKATQIVPNSQFQSEFGVRLRF